MLLTFRQLTDSLQKLSKIHLNENPEQVKGNLNVLKAWINENQNFHFRMEDQFLISFLRGCKFNRERARRKLYSFYAIRSENPEIFKNRLVTDEMIDFIKSGLFLPLFNKDGPRIFMFRSGFLAGQINVHNILKWISMILDIMMLEDDNLVIAGCLCIIDLDGSALANWRHFTPVSIKKYISDWSSMYPIQLKGCQFINRKSFFMSSYVALKTFLTEKVQSRVRRSYNMVV